MQVIEAFVNAAAKSVAPAKTRTLPLAKAG